MARLWFHLYLCNYKWHQGKEPCEWETDFLWTLSVNKVRSPVALLAQSDGCKACWAYFVWPGAYQGSGWGGGSLCMHFSHVCLSLSCFDTLAVRKKVSIVGGVLPCVCDATTIFLPISLLCPLVYNPMCVPDVEGCSESTPSFQTIPWRELFYYNCGSQKFAFGFTEWKLQAYGSKINKILKNVVLKEGRIFKYW